MSTVTVIPELIVTASAEVGIAAPPQVAVLLQSPLTEAVRAAPRTKEEDNNKNTKNTIGIILLVVVLKNKVFDFFMIKIVL